MSLSGFNSKPLLSWLKQSHKIFGSEMKMYIIAGFAIFE